MNDNFIEFEVADNLTGEGLFKIIMQIIEKLGLEKQYIVEERYNGYTDSTIELSCALI
jgi:hypothetical protein